MLLASSNTLKHMETLVDITIMQNSKWLLNHLSYLIFLIISDKDLILSPDHVFPVSRKTKKHMEILFDITTKQNSK